MGKHIQQNADDASLFGFVVDEDNMASNSATKVPTQQSTKAYVDTKVAGGIKSIALNAHPFFLVLSNTTTETALNGSSTLIGGTAVNSSILKWALTGTLLNNTGSDVTFTIRIKIGSLTWVTHTVTATTHATARQFVINIPTLCADFLGLRLSGVSTMNVSDPAGGEDYIKSVATDVSVIALASNQTISITGQMNTASANAQINLSTAVLNVSLPT